MKLSDIPEEQIREKIALLLNSQSSGTISEEFKPQKAKNDEFINRFKIIFDEERAKIDLEGPTLQVFVLQLTVHAFVLGWLMEEEAANNATQRDI